MSSSTEPTLATMLDRLVDRLRSLPDYRLGRPLEGYEGQSLAEVTYRNAVWCVAAEAGVAGRSLAEPPRLRPLPRLHDLSCGDQLHVVVADLLEALDTVPDGGHVWLDAQRVPALAVREKLRARLRVLRDAI